MDDKEGWKNPKDLLYKGLENPKKLIYGGLYIDQKRYRKGNGFLPQKPLQYVNFGMKSFRTLERALKIEPFCLPVKNLI